MAEQVKDEPGRQFAPFVGNKAGHLVHVWTDGEGLLWACCAYDHGPFCRLCQRCDEMTITLLGQVEQGDMEVRAGGDGSFMFKLTEQGTEKARRLISEPGEMQEFYDRLVTSEMDKRLDGPGEK